MEQESNDYLEHRQDKWAIFLNDVGYPVLALIATLIFCFLFALSLMFNFGIMY